MREIVATSEPDGIISNAWAVAGHAPATYSTTTHVLCRFHTSGGGGPPGSRGRRNPVFRGLSAATRYYPNVRENSGGDDALQVWSKRRLNWPKRASGVVPMQSRAGTLTPATDPCGGAIAYCFCIDFPNLGGRLRPDRCFRPRWRRNDASIALYTVELDQDSDSRRSHLKSSWSSNPRPAARSRHDCGRLAWLDRAPHPPVPRNAPAPRPAGSRRRRPRG